ncbi:MAG: PEP-CTERM sorting domain-containing protein [Pirellulaceae bacterium]
MNSNRFSAMVAYVATLCFTATRLHADLLLVDFGVADLPSVGSNTPNHVATGYFDFSVVPQFSGNSRSDFVNTGTGSISRTFAGIGVTLFSSPPPNNGFTFDDYVGEIADVGSVPGDLVEERVRIVQGDLTVRLSNLTAGNYLFTGFHHDAGGVSNALPFDIYVNNGSGELLAVANVETSIGLSPASVSVSQFGFLATGGDIFIRLDGGGTGANLINPVINGFQVASVPEPGSLVLLSVLGVLAAAHRRRQPRSKAVRSHEVRRGTSLDTRQSVLTL